MMEAIGRNSPIESTPLDVAQNKNNDETNFKLNVVENSPHDEDDDDNNHKEGVDDVDANDDEDVVEVREQLHPEKTSLNSQIFVVDEDEEEKMSQTVSINGPNKTCVESNKEETQINDEAVIVNNEEIKQRVEEVEEECPASHQLEQDNFDEKQIEKSQSDKCEALREKSTERESPTNVLQDVKQIEQIDAQMQVDEDLKSAQKTCRELVNSEENKRSPPPQILAVPVIVDVTEDSEEDELLKSDDEKNVKEKSVDSENKVNIARTLRIEIEDSLDSMASNKKDEDAVEIINITASTEACNVTADLDQTTPLLVDNSISERGVQEDLKINSNHDVKDIDREVVSISDDESEHEENDEQNHQQKQHLQHQQQQQQQKQQIQQQQQEQQEEEQQQQQHQQEEQQEQYQQQQQYQHQLHQLQQQEQQQQQQDHEQQLQCSTIDVDDDVVGEPIENETLELEERKYIPMDVNDNNVNDEDGVAPKKILLHGEVINLDEDSQDGMHTDIKMEEQTEIKPATECITINEESEELPGEQEKLNNDCSSDDSNSSIEFQESCSPHKVDDRLKISSPQQQHQGKFNGVDEHSNDGLTMDITDEEDDVVDNQRCENDERAESEKFQISHSQAVSPVWPNKHQDSQDLAATIEADSFDVTDNFSDEEGEGDNLITSIKRQLLKNENSSPSVPKLNGEHKTPETDETQAVIDVMQAANDEAVDEQPSNVDINDEDEDDNNDDSSNLKIIDEQSHDAFSKENSRHTDEVSRSPRGPTMLLNESDDEASRFSMASEQSSSTATSSSHQLVIDHPSDEIETPLPSYPPPALPPPPPPPSFSEVNNESDSQAFPFLPLKISLKRKLSRSGETYEASSPQQKMAHLEREDDNQQYDSVYNEQSVDQQISPILNGENMELEQEAEQPTDLNSVSRSQIPSLQMVQTAYQKDQTVPAHEEVSQKGQNQEPMVTEMPSMNKSHEEVKQKSPSRSSPLLNSLLMKKLPKQQSSNEKFDNFIAPPKPKKTKYLCFNCKSGSFSSLIALNEHQNICLANKFLFSAGPTASPPTANTIHTKKNSSTAAQHSPPSVSPQQTPLEAAVAVHSPALTSQQPQPTPATSIEKRVYYQCSSCKTYHENWNLFLHLREIHKRHTCLYCIRMFPTAEKLSLHLEIKHDLEQNHFNSEEAFRKSIEMIDGRVSEARFLMCCTCQHVFLDHEPFSDHVCTEYIQACTLCGQKGRHTNQCKAQNEAKRSKVKKKSKLRESRTGTKSLPPESSSLQSNPPAVMPQTEIAFNTPHMQTTNCDNVPSAPHHASFAPSSHTALPTLTHQTLHQSQQQLKLHNEDSNNSCNMVIDETCNSAYNNRSKPYNPFKALDEHELLQQEANVTQPVLPPDRHQLTEQAVEKPEPVQPLIVPKFKLRVPKEFQKSVDAVISTSESEDDEDMVINEDEADKSENSRLSTTPHGEIDVENESLANAEQSRSQDAGEECSKHSSGAVDDDDSMDEPNSNLVRILQEIERTKLDIMRTKDALHSSSKATSGGQRQATISQSSSRAGDRNWSPTPPASPNSHWYTPRRPIIQGASIGGVAASEGGQANEVQTQNEPSLQPMAPPQLPAGPIQREQRRNTTGSDMDMDIDETISGQPVQCIERPLLRAASAEHETDKSVDITNESAVDKPNVSTDSSFGDVDIMNNSNTNAEEANKDVRSEEENSQQMEEEQTPHKTLEYDKRMLGESMETEQNTSTSEMDTPIKQEELNVEFSSDKEEEDKNESVEEPHPPLPSSPATEPAPPPPPPPPALPADGIIVADEETISVDLQLDRPLEKFEIIEFVRICLKAVYPLCLYCNHARRIAVNGKSLVLHLIAQHRFAATVDSITAEELKPSTIVSKLKSYLPELEDHYFNSNSYCTYRKDAFTHPFNERIFECFQCRFVTSTHKELYLHNRKMHLRTAILCFMCRSNFFSFSEILCHVCPGESHKISVFDIKFRCCLCEVDNIPSPFRLMVHLRKKHFACDVCLEDCRDQGRLSSHVWKHKLHHLCYRCGIAYRNKMDITKHLFWKHGTESIICKRCLQKRWRHVYHFCVPPADFICDICNLCFSKATYLKVHKRIHTGDLRYPCTDENCEQKFISRRLLLKHTAEHQMFEMNESQQAADEKEKLLEQKESTDEVKKEQQIQIKEENLDDVKELPLKEENKVETGEQADAKTESSGEKTTESPGTTSKSTAENDNISSCKQRKKKKSKRSKESLEDLNLTAPNLSESDSSDESDVEVKSKSGDDSLVPKVMLSPPSDTENLKDDDELGAKKETHADEKVLDIWKNLMQAQGAGDSTDTMRDPKDCTENYKPPPVKMHVAQSDHDYCLMTQPEKPKPKESVAVSQASPQKRNKTAKSPRHNSAKRSDASSGSSSSGSSSDSSCSCGSNCSCSSSNSGSSSSSSSSNDSDDSSGASHASRKRHRKKSERDRMRKKSESLSPMKKHNMSEGSGRSILGGDVDVGTEETQPTEENESTPKEPLFYESDLETAESETDEEFYDEHPQKLATELLAQKRAQLMAQTRLSPSHNFDIVENSRPSTPSLPDEVARERKIKLKKKKRERKSTSRSIAPGVGVPPLKLNLSTPASPNATQVQESDNLTDAAQQIVPATTIASSIDPSSYDLMRRQSFGIAETTISAPQQFNTAVHGVSGQQLTPRPIGPQHHLGRISEGSSCSDADGSLKRSKRARRPNKFYGYTSDEENNISGLGQPVMMGMRAIKPQPPPQLTWRKEDLPTPSKSILNNNKIKNPRTPKTPSTPQTPGGNLFNTNISGPMSSMLKKKGTVRGNANAKNRKRNNQKSKVGSKLPPIPTLKIRSSQIGLTPSVPSAGGGTNHIPASQIYSSSKESDEEDDDDEEVDSTDTSSDDDGAQEMVAPSTSGTNVAWNSSLLQAPGTTPNAPVAALLLPQVAPAPPPPQAVAFNQKIPPALLPNPDFATLQYFKANNIRYPIRPPAGARQAREGESVYCYCRCPYDEVSEMIACDGENCLIEWFHFECVGIMVAPQGKWFCAECRPKYSEELYPTASTA